MPEQIKLLSNLDGRESLEDVEEQPSVSKREFDSLPEWSSDRASKGWLLRPQWLSLVGGFVAGAILVLAMIKLLSSQSQFDAAKKSGLLSLENLKKPEGFPIVGIVFFGRREFTDVLDCYLRQNLVRNGGYLDEVRFIVHTKNQGDVLWINDLVATEPAYRRVNVNGKYDKIYHEQMRDSNAMYIKIDDDVVFVDKHAIPRIVHGLIAHPEAFALSPYIINNSRTNWLSYHTGAIFPYLPENKTLGDQRTLTWRPSLLPEYPSNISIPDHYDHSAYPMHENHRWLPLPNTGLNLQKTPMRDATWLVFGTAWESWASAAQQHYSFFQNYEDSKLERYLLGTPEDGIWDMKYERYSINFLAIWGSTINSAKITAADELDLTVTNPQKLGMPLLIDSRAIISHFGYSSHSVNLSSTDVLDRYRALANEVSCPTDMQKVHFVDEPR
ncbi:MAG: hypothetical protein M1828_001381 [Chrysothrix sp. TS-e1954]|nr:MAG: hypothetical protein M1828_001381 [Chrysothrix sp. TS-e1954]